MVLNRLSEAGGRGAGGFVGGIFSNPAIILVIIALGGLFIFRDKISEGFGTIGKGLFNLEFPDISLPDITFPTFEFPEITFPDITFPDITFPDFNFPDITFPEFPDFKFPDIFGPKDPSVMVSPEQMILNEMELAKDCECGISAINQDALGVVTTTCATCPEQEPEVFGPIGPLDPDRPITIEDVIPETEQQTESTFAGIMTSIVSMLPDTMQKFIGGGPSFIGGTIFENPIDTFSEVLFYFPELTASQASDFLLETGGKLLPSQVPFFDPDIKNIVANIGGENIPVDTTTFPSELQEQELIASKLTCELFGLNCEFANQGFA